MTSCAPSRRSRDVRWPGFSGMVCFRHPRATSIVANTRIFTLAESLGGVESLLEVPQAMTHQSVEGSSAAVPADLVRLSCGVEAASDLVEDLRQAIQPRPMAEVCSILDGMRRTALIGAVVACAAAAGCAGDEQPAPQRAAVAAAPGAGDGAPAAAEGPRGQGGRAGRRATRTPAGRPKSRRRRRRAEAGARRRRRAVRRRSRAPRPPATASTRRPRCRTGSRSRRSRRPRPCAR